MPHTIPNCYYAFDGPYIFRIDLILVMGRRLGLTLQETLVTTKTYVTMEAAYAPVALIAQIQSAFLVFGRGRYQ